MDDNCFIQILQSTQTKVSGAHCIDDTESNQC